MDRSGSTEFHVIRELQGLMKIQELLDLYDTEADCRMTRGEAVGRCCSRVNYMVQNAVVLGDEVSGT